MQGSGLVMKKRAPKSKYTDVAYSSLSSNMAAMGEIRSRENEAIWSEFSRSDVPHKMSERNSVAE